MTVTETATLTLLDGYQVLNLCPTNHHTKCGRFFCHALYKYSLYSPFCFKIMSFSYIVIRATVKKYHNKLKF